MSTKAFNISMPAELVAKIDQQSKLQGGNRSDFIRRAVYKQLGVLEQWQALANATRAGYKGKILTEPEVAAIVREDRQKQAR
jgi:metal-responsive CopG/Arc/MetJ family transcriptional regulator